MHTTSCYCLIKSTYYYLTLKGPVCQDHRQWTLFLFSLFTLFYFSFLFLEQLGLESISHAVTSVTN